MALNQMTQPRLMYLIVNYDIKRAIIFGAIEYTDCVSAER